MAHSRTRRGVGDRVSKVHLEPSQLARGLANAPLAPLILVRHTTTSGTIQRLPWHPHPGLLACLGQVRGGGFRIPATGATLGLLALGLGVLACGHFPPTLCSLLRGFGAPLTPRDVAKKDD
ncbi:hypothetical protein EDB87DRAFT_1575374 [Lactarius vividus]|nr:hypothetical protein EDB87DRAFT_1575374 [Lactarius vividus]